MEKILLKAESWKQILHFVMNTDSKAQYSCHPLLKWFLQPRTSSCENLAGTGKKYYLIKQKIYHSEHTAGQSQLQASAGN